MQLLFKIGLFLPIGLALLLAIGKIGYARFVRFAPVGPPVKVLEVETLNKLYDGQTILCVGCTSGIGFQVAQSACEHGAKVVVVGRRVPVFEGKGCLTISHAKADLSSMKSAKETITKLNTKYKFSTVVFTQGITSKPIREETKEGIEMDLAVSFLSRYVMAEELIPHLTSTETRKARVFIMGFPGQNGSTPDLNDFNSENPATWKSWGAHMQGVVGNEALVSHLAKKHTNINVYGLNPGIVWTEIMTNFLGGNDTIPFRALQSYVQTVCPSAKEYVQGALQHILISPELEAMSGSSFNQYAEPIQKSKWLQSPANEEAVMKAADNLLARKISI